jgi:hypothetical protein
MYFERKDAILLFYFLLSSLGFIYMCNAYFPFICGMQSYDNRVSLTDLRLLHGAYHLNDDNDVFTFQVYTMSWSPSTRSRDMYYDGVPSGARAIREVLASSLPFCYVQNPRHVMEQIEEGASVVQIQLERLPDAPDADLGDRPDNRPTNITLAVALLCDVSSPSSSFSDY